MKQNKFKKWQGRGYSGLARVLAMLALLMTAATGAWAQDDPEGTPTVSVSDLKYEGGLYFYEVTATAKQAYGMDTDLTYTTDGTTPTASSPAYTGPIKCYKNQTVKFQAHLMGTTIPGAAKDATITFSFEGPTISVDGAKVTISTNLNNAKTYYKLNGGDAVEGTEVTLTQSATVTAYVVVTNGTYANFTSSESSKEVTLQGDPVDVTGVTLPATATVTLGDPVALTAAVAPADATDKKVKWSITSGSDKVKLYKDAECKTEVGTDATDALTVYAKGLAVGEATVKVESNADATKSATCTVTAKHGTYAVAMKDGVADADKWTAKAGQDGQYQAMPLKGVEGGTKPVELKYAGDREVKRVTMRVVPAWKGDLSKLSATELESDGVTVLVKDGMTLTGTLSENYKITIADGATVTLDGVTINGTNDENYKWAGISCAGSATINLADDSENTVKGFHSDYPGIHVPMGSTLTIQGGSAGTGKLTASSNGNAAGIGGGKNMDCGSIAIIGVNVTATGGGKAAGIGGGEAAGCGFITILDGVTPVKVKAMKGAEATNSIGAGTGGTCGAVNIGNTIYDDGDAYLAQAKIEYPEPAANSVDLSKLTADYEAQDGEVLTGTLGANVKISIAAGATVTLDGVTINGVKSKDFKWAGITCVGDATIILKDGTTNTVMGFKADYPGIFIASDKTLTIKGETAGTGSLNARSNGSGAGIGGGYQIACGNIEIQGGVITATGGSNSAGIGSGRESSCGNITISGGSVTATGGANGAGIGSGYAGSCGNITITTGVTQVTATKGDYAPNSIGKAEGSSSCGTVTIGGSVTGNITTSPYTYQPSN